MKVADFNARIAPVAVRLVLEGSPVFPYRGIGLAAHGKAPDGRPSGALPSCRHSGAGRPGWRRSPVLAAGFGPKTKSDPNG